VEAWNYIVNQSHGEDFTGTKIREVLAGKWGEGVLIKVRTIGLVWSDEDFRALATKLASGPAATHFDIETLDKLRRYRLKGVSFHHLAFIKRSTVTNGASALGYSVE
jgi:hypothetical protein